eukprot:TRINITY_DN1598_c0_g1_i1.p2 TRINITY_DN1598_c0_g1~~TRINITY_DN1598_c0_g1_i1.p2  ORF type:complete len:186 (-),score=58.12 TRINITY_DN1598_c0_g1_i1:87-644(-)
MTAYGPDVYKYKSPNFCFLDCFWDLCRRHKAVDPEDSPLRWIREEAIKAGKVRREQEDIDERKFREERLKRWEARVAAREGAAVPEWRTVLEAKAQEAQEKKKRDAEIEKIERRLTEEQNKERWAIRLERFNQFVEMWLQSIETVESLRRARLDQQIMKHFDRLHTAFTTGIEHIKKSEQEDEED